MQSVQIPAKDGTAISALTLGFDSSIAKAAVIICHGFGEHAGCYIELAEKLHSAGFASIIPNQRGTGSLPWT